jgi:hypothetical protein
MDVVYLNACSQKHYRSGPWTPVVIQDTGIEVPHVPICLLMVVINYQIILKSKQPREEQRTFPNCL